MIEKLLQKDLLVKISALIIALLIWWQIMPIENPITTKVVDVNLTIEVPEGKRLSGQPVNRVAITFEGRARSLAQVKAEDIVVPFDISNAPVGTSAIPVEYASPYSGVEVTDINPSVVTISLTTEESKEVGIDVLVKGTPNKEYIAQSPTYSRETVTVTGPKDNVERVQVARGEIVVTGAVGPTTATVRLYPIDVYGVEIAEIQVNPPEIEVTVPLQRKLPAKTVEVKVDTQGTPRKGYKLVGATATPRYVEIRGEPSITGKVTSISTQPVDVSGREAGFTGEYVLTLPSGVFFEASNKVTVAVDIQPDIVTKTFPSIVVQPENLPIGFTFDIDPTQVDVMLTGRSDILEQVKAADVQAFINAGDINPLEIGSKQSYQLWVIPGALPEGVKVDIKPSKVTLTLTER